MALYVQNIEELEKLKEINGLPMSDIQQRAVPCPLDCQQDLIKRIGNTTGAERDALQDQLLATSDSGNHSTHKPINTLNLLFIFLFSHQTRKC